MKISIVGQYSVAVSINRYIRIMKAVEAEEPVGLPRLTKMLSSTFMKVRWAVYWLRDNKFVDSTPIGYVIKDEEWRDTFIQRIDEMVSETLKQL